MLWYVLFLTGQRETSPLFLGGGVVCLSLLTLPDNEEMMIASGATSIPGRARGSRIWARHFPLHGTDGSDGLACQLWSAYLPLVPKISPSNHPSVQGTKKDYDNSLPGKARFAVGFYELDSGEKNMLIAFFSFLIFIFF